nr:hypothetical protein [Corallococcus exercitus]
MTYYADGTVQTRKDGRNNTTTFSNYKRGIPQYVQTPDSTTVSNAVNDIGLITSATNEAGWTTSYGYDLMGRLNRVVQPTGDTVVWNDMALDFSYVLAPEYGLPAGHWRQTITTGAAVSINYMDALWRPVVSRTYDANNPGATSKVIVRAFDFNGNTTFESYPQRSVSAYTDRPVGTSTTYDALSRVTQLSADSELGRLNTSTVYGTGFQKSVTNARGHRTTTTYQVFDMPGEDAVRTISAPEGVSVSIARDVFGKPTSITRGGGGKSATRNLVYDAYQRLCKTIEPESGATLQDYDAANNVAWRAAGQGLPVLTCDRANVPAGRKSVFNYDARNRLVSTTYGDNSPGVTRSYTPDGLPLTVVSNGATWTTTYNRRRLPISEVLGYNGQTYTLGWGYSANGHVSQLTYPVENNPINAKTVVYAPNALGEPTQVGPYATSISYHPNGAVAGFVYGNGRVRSLTQNVRGLPLVARDTGVLLDQYSYDPNGNVLEIADQQENIASRSMGYDGLDRLIIANAPGIWGNAAYGYDALDNLVSSSIGSRNNVYNYDAANRLTGFTSNFSDFNYAYAYDAQGNITQRGAQTFSFDIANRMSAAANKATYSYDGFGRRVKAVATNGMTTISLYSPAGQLLYTTQSGGPTAAKTTQYVYLRRHVIAEVSK